MSRHQGLSFSLEMLEEVKRKTLKLCTRLEELFSDMRVVYSGRGYHIHVMDSEVYGWDRRRRGRLAMRLKREEVPIDTWVTTGGSRLIRLPHSLHGMVSRITTPVDIDELEGFNPLTDARCLPIFLKATSS